MTRLQRPMLRTRPRLPSLTLSEHPQAPDRQEQPASERHDDQNFVFGPCREERDEGAEKRRRDEEREVAVERGHPGLG
jgi:hypothetical protein